MVGVTYRHEKEEISGECAADASLLFVNGNGSYYLTAPCFSDLAHTWSRYEGMHIPYRTKDGWSICKTLARISPATGNVTSILQVEKSSTINYSTGAQLTISLFPDDVLAITAMHCADALQLILDCRAIYDFDSHGRFYSVENCKSSGDEVIAKENFQKFVFVYRKRNSDDESAPIAKLPDSSQEYTMFVAVAVSNGAKLQQIGSWFGANSVLESQRGSSPSTLYNYHAANIVCTPTTQVFIASGFDKEKVLEKLAHAVENSEHITRTMRQYTNSIVSTVPTILTSPQLPSSQKGSSFKLASLGLQRAIISLDALFVSPTVLELVDNKRVEGIYAGLPWFYQFWTRDEAVSLGGFISLKRFRDVKQILMRQLRGILVDGRLSNRFPRSELGSADGIGWCAKRWHDLIKQCVADRILGDVITNSELAMLRDFFIDSYEKLREAHSKDYSELPELGGMISNAPLETWMDTHAADDVRAGFRIEIQALALIQLRLINTLISLVGNSKNSSQSFNRSFIEEESTLAKNVAQQFFVNGKLIDGITVDEKKSSVKIDATQRPNIFLAHYLYPNLLSTKQWESAFDAALNALWLGWGGLASIDVLHPLFCPAYTGEDNRSYHRGDSWYFLNNIAAICLWRVNSQKYRASVEAIISSSSHDLLWQSALGWSSEVSSARNQSASGCIAQAWSLGTYIELMQIVFGK